MPLAGLTMVVLAVLSAIYLAMGQTTANGWVTHTIRVEMRMAELLEGVRAIESSHRGYLIDADAGFLDDLDRSTRYVRRKLAEIETATVDNPTQQANLAELRPLLSQKIAFARRSVELVRRGSVDVGRDMVATGNGRVLMTNIRDRILLMRAEEDRLLAERVAQRELAVIGIAIGLALAVLLVVIVGYITVTDARRRQIELEGAVSEAESANVALRAEGEAREEAESRVRQMQKMESVGQLTGGIAHDFNNMLAIVIGSLDMARNRIDDPDRLSKYISNAREGAERAASLTARLLAFSRQQPLAPVAIDANRLVAGMSELLQRTLGEQVSIETVLAGGLWATYADPGQLENAIVNLAVNARDAMPEGGRLTIETANAHLDDDYARDRAEVEAGQYVLVCVSDTGTGMPPEVIAKAFDPFFTTKGVGKGTGLGLSQVFGFVKQSGGHVAIYSEPGEGTTVKLYLRRHMGKAGEVTRQQAAEAIPAGSLDEVILVVEDEQRVRHFSVDALRELGYTVLSAGSPAEALQILADQPKITLLFTDIVMPDMNGRALSEAARAILPGLNVLFTTGYTRNAVVHNGMLDTGVAFLPKPFTIMQLALKVREVIDGGGINRPA